MKLNSILNESFITEHTTIAEDTVVAVHELENIMEDISNLKVMMEEETLSEEEFNNRMKACS